MVYLTNAVKTILSAVNPHKITLIQKTGEGFI